MVHFNWFMFSNLELKSNLKMRKLNTELNKRDLEYEESILHYSNMPCFSTVYHAC